MYRTFEEFSRKIEKGDIQSIVIDKEERREKRIRHYNNYRELLESSKVKNNHEMSKLTGIYPTMFTDWSKGRCEPNAEKLLAICKVLKVNPKKIIN